MTRHFTFLFITTFTTGCLTGNSYPEHYAQAYCESLFTCVPGDQIELATSLLSTPYETVEECIATESSNTRGSVGFDSFQEGDATFNKENAQACIEEAEQVLSDSDCDGNMDILSFSADAMTESCGDVYVD